MSRLEELIQIHCPDGVNYRKLGEICQIATGKLNVNKQSENGKYPFFTCAKEVYRINTFAFDTEALLISGNGNVGYIHYYKGKFNAYQRTYVLSDFSENIFFIKYVLEAGLKKRIEEGLMLGSVPYIKLETLSGFLVPILPPPVQEEIVRILDTFTALETELENQLEAELAARVRQYEHYRNELLSFDSNSKIMEKFFADYAPNGVDYFKLQEVFDFRNGYTPSTANDAFWENGSISWFTMKDLRSNGGILAESIEKVTPEAVKGELFEKDSVIISTSATIGEHALLLVDALANQRFTCLTRKTKFKSTLSPMFVFYYCFLLDEWCRENTNISGFASVDMGRFAKFKFPVPPLEIQEQIVSILDRFDNLVSDLKTGLPAEIALRRKQYEYYRDKLLNFKPLE